MKYPSEIGADLTQEVGYFETTPAAMGGLLTSGFYGRDWVASFPRWENFAHARSDLEASSRPDMRTRYAFAPVGEWSLMISNGPGGTDVGLLPSRAAEELGCRAVRAVLDDSGPFPACILELCQGDADPDGFYVRRQVSVAKDGDRWDWANHGEPFPFEDVEQYQAKGARDRFTPVMLERYLMALGVPVDDEPDWTDAVVVALHQT